MFYILLLSGIFGAIGGVIWFFNTNFKKGWLPIVLIVFSLGVFVCSWFTPQGEVYRLQLIASGQKGNWLVVDNSGGETMRHWILQDSYVGSSDQSDGWKFKTKDGIAYVSGDAFVIRISGPLDVFSQDYKRRYNIPNNQTPLE